MIPELSSTMRMQVRHPINYIHKQIWDVWFTLKWPDFVQANFEKPFSIVWLHVKCIRFFIQNSSRFPGRQTKNRLNFRAIKPNCHFVSHLHNFSSITNYHSHNFYQTSEKELTHFNLQFTLTTKHHNP